LRRSSLQTKAYQKGFHENNIFFVADGSSPFYARATQSDYLTGPSTIFFIGARIGAFIPAHEDKWKEVSDTRSGKSVRTGKIRITKMFALSSHWAK
jgi:hypothetical protein